MERIVEYRFAPLKLDEGERQVLGTAVPWDSIGHGDKGPERFMRSAFGPVEDFQMFNLTVQHDRGLGVSADLNFRDTVKGLEVAATLANTTRGKDTLEEIRAGILRGFSIEFIALEERQENRVRVLDRALLLGLSIVDIPAYPSASVDEIRNRRIKKAQRRAKRRRFF